MGRTPAVHEDGCYNVSGEHVVGEVLAVMRRDLDKVQEARESHGERLGLLEQNRAALDERTRRSESDIDKLRVQQHEGAQVMQVALGNSERALEEIAELKTHDAKNQEKLWDEIGKLRTGIADMKDEVHRVALKVALIVGAIAAAGGVGGSFLASAMRAAG